MFSMSATAQWMKALPSSSLAERLRSRAWEQAQKVNTSLLPKNWFEEAAQDFAIEHGDDLTKVPEKGALASLRKIMMPKLRRIMPQMLASDIVGVQPMTEPAGLIFSLKPNYGKL